MLTTPEYGVFYSDAMLHLLLEFHLQMLHLDHFNIMPIYMLSLSCQYSVNKFESYLDYITTFAIRCTLAKLSSVLITFILRQEDSVKTKYQETKWFAPIAEP